MAIRALWLDDPPVLSNHRSKNIFSVAALCSLSFAVLKFLCNYLISLILLQLIYTSLFCFPFLKILLCVLFLYCLVFLLHLFLNVSVSLKHFELRAIERFYRNKLLWLDVKIAVSPITHMFPCIFTLFLLLGFSICSMLLRSVIKLSFPALESVIWIKWPNCSRTSF